MSRIGICVIAVLASATTVTAQPPGTNYDEAKVPEYKLPSSLVLNDGTPVRDANAWVSQRRPEVLELFRREMYGRSPAPRRDMSFELTDHELRALDGTAVRKQVRVYFSADRSGPSMEILIYLPRGSAAPSPMFLGLNFGGNHTVHADPAIHLSTSWMRDRPGVVDHRATEESRGTSASRWDIATILSRGYGLATIYYGDIDPDFHDEFQNGVHPLFDEKAPSDRSPDAWGSIAAWSWGLSRAMDYFETDRDIDQTQVAVMGHSRLGKTSLWAGAEDPRFAIVISNNSGCGGAALSRRRFGETVKRINTVFPHWFCDNFKKYNDNEDELPLDQHMLMALIAPRPVYVASAVEDQWADPRGEFESAFQADDVYRLLGTSGIGGASMPGIDQPVMHTIGYHIRTGKHDVTSYDWKCYLDFADKHFGNQTSREEK